MTRNKRKVADLALLGGSLAFDSPLPVGQLNFPEWARFEESMRGIFARRFYTNHGPLADELEVNLASVLQVKHVVAVTNATLGLMIAAKALDIRGRVIVPAFTFVASAQSLTWAGLEPVFCDVDPITHQMDPRHAAKLINDEVGAILCVHLWGRPCYPDEFTLMAKKYGIPLYFDAAHAFGCTSSTRSIASLGALSVFSFHATKIINAMEGGCVCTDDDAIAARLRNIRSSYGAGPRVAIPLSSNARMSEAQAAMALLSLADYAANRERNRVYQNAYHDMLRDIPGIHLYSPPPTETTNHQFVVAEIAPREFGLSRDQLFRILQAENVICRRYFSPGIHRTQYYREHYPYFLTSMPVTDRLCDTVLQLPSGQVMDPEKISAVCSLIRFVHENAVALASI